MILEFEIIIWNLCARISVKVTILKSELSRKRKKLDFIKQGGLLSNQILFVRARFVKRAG